jgi:hypothetical protein
MDTFSSLANSGLLNQFNQGGGQTQAKADTSGTDAQTKAAKKAWKALQKSINSQYNQDVQTGTQGLDQAKQQDLLKLNAMFNFGNSDPNDTQRIQYNQRTQNDYQGQLKDLLAKLSQSRDQQLNTGQQGYQNNLQTIAQAVQAQQAKTQQLAQSQAQQQFNNKLSLMKLLGYGKQQTNTGAIQGGQTSVDVDGNPIVYNTSTGQWEYQY